MVSKKAGSKLDEEYRQKASELVNFYNDNNTVITRRPPLQKWDLEKVGHRFEDLTVIDDYLKLDTGEELALIKGIDESTARWLIDSNEGIAGHSKTQTGSTSVFTETDESYTNAVSYSVTFGGNSLEYVITYTIDKGKGFVVKRGGNIKQDILVPVQIAVSIAGVVSSFITHSHIERNIEAQSGVTTNKATLSYSANQHLASVRLYVNADNLNIKTLSIVDEYEIKYPDKFGLRDDQISLTINDLEYEYISSTDSFSHTLYRSFIAHPEDIKVVNPDRFPGNTIPQEIILPAVRVAALYSNIGPQTAELTTEDYVGDNGLIGDWSLEELRDFVDSEIVFLDGTNSASGTTGTRFDISSRSNMKANMKRILVRILPTLENRLMPVTTVIPVGDGYKVAPDIKLSTSHNEVRSICEELHSDEEIQVWSYPERNDRSYLDDSLTQVGKVVKGTKPITDVTDNSTISEGIVPNEFCIEYRPNKAKGTILLDPKTSEEEFRRIEKDEADKVGLGGSAYLRSIDDDKIGTGTADAEALIDFAAATDIVGTTTAISKYEFIKDKVFFAVLPKTWRNKIPRNGGSLSEKAERFDTLVGKDSADNADTGEESRETREIREALKDLDPQTAQFKASWGYSVAKNTDETFPQGAGHGRYSGVGAAFVALPFSPDWEDISETATFSVGYFRLRNILPPFVTVYRSLVGAAAKLSFKGKAFKGGFGKLNAKREDKIRIKKMKETRKKFFYDAIDGEGFDIADEDFEPTTYEKFGSPGLGTKSSQVDGTVSLTFPDELKGLDIIAAKQRVMLLSTLYSQLPTAIKFRVYYDYSNPELKKWYDDKDLVNVTIAKEFGNASTGSVTENISLVKSLEPVSSTDLLKIKDTELIGDVYSTNRVENGDYNTSVPGTVIGGNGSSNILPSSSDILANQTQVEIWSKQFKMRLFDLPAIDNITSELIPDTGSSTINGLSNSTTDDVKRSVLGSFWFGPQPMIFPGPTYKLAGGSFDGFYPTKELEKPLNDAYFIGNLYPITSVGTLVNPRFSTEDEVAFVMDREARGHNAPMACYSVNVLNLDLKAKRVDTRSEDRDISEGGDNVYVSSHSITGSKKQSDYTAIYWSKTHNIPIGDISRRNRDIPSYLNPGQYPASAPQPLRIPEGEIINSVVEHEGNILIATNDQVLQISRASLGPNAYAGTKRILSRGIDTNIVHESTNYFGAQGDQIVSFKYYEQANGYLGFNETKEYDVEVITQMETFIQKHNLAVAVAGGTNSIHILALGGDRRTNGFSRFDFPFVVTGVRKLDHDRMLIFFEGERPRVLDFASRDKSIRYADYISETEFKIYKSTAATLPVVNLGADSFKSVKYSSIKNVMIYLAEQITAFTISIKSKNNIVKRQVNINDILVDANPYSAARPFLLEGMSLNTTVAPIVAIETQSDENLEFSSLVLDLKDI